MLIAVLLIQYLVCAWFSAGLLFAELQGLTSMFADEERRSHLGCSIIAGALCGLLSIAGVFLALCLSGFAQHGFWICGGSRRGKKIWEVE